MPETMTIPITMDGDDQVVRLPEAFRLPSSEVRVRRSGASLLLEPVKPRMSRAEIEAIFAELEKYRDIPFMEDGREQPPMPDDDDLPSIDP